MYQLSFNPFIIGTKIECKDNYGYSISPFCGTIEQHIGDGHAIIKDNSGVYWSTMAFPNRPVHSIEIIRESTRYSQYPEMKHSNSISYFAQCWTSGSAFFFTHTLEAMANGFDALTEAIRHECEHSPNHLSLNISL